MTQFWIGVGVGVGASAAFYLFHVLARIKALESRVQASIKAKL